MSTSRTFSGVVLAGLLLSVLTVPTTRAFSDVRSGQTPYATAIEALQEAGVVEGYDDGSYKPSVTINRAEFLKIILESRGGDFSGKKCFPDVRDEWFAQYVCTAKEEGIIEGYPDGKFRPEQTINFVEASKILSLAYDQEVQEGTEWYEPYVRALESSKAIPPSIVGLEKKVSRGEMAEMMWRIKDQVTDQPSKGYLNVKYPEVSVDLSADTPQRATSCMDLQAFAKEAQETGMGRGMIMESTGMPMDGMMRTTESAVPAMDQAKSNVVDHSETNVQVEGVDEADIVKTDGEYLYIVQNQMIRIVRAHPASEMSLVSTVDLEDSSFNPTELYIDGDRLVVIGGTWSHGSRPVIQERMMDMAIMPPPYYDRYRTQVRIYDVSDRGAPRLERKVSFDGSSVSSRRIGNRLYLVMNQSVMWRPDPRPMPLEADVLPSYQDSANSEEDQPVAKCSDVMILPRVPYPQYLIVGVISLDNASGEIQREVILGSAENIYASLGNLYVANTEWNYHWRILDGGDDAEAGDDSYQKTNVYRFAFTDDGVELKAQGTVPGHILNQFSMDEHEGYFRIATTDGELWDSRRPATNNLYILNGDMERVGEIEGIAPGEKIYSVRFMGDRTYMVTFKNIDPFFVIDTSDPRNPAILGKLKIPGYSDYLHPYDETHIIGFGKEAVQAKDREDFAWYQGIKVALFDVTDPENPTEIDKVVIGDRGTDSPLLRNHKALLFEKDRNLLAFPVQVHEITGKEAYRGDPAGAYGDPVFQGAYVYDVSLQGFNLRGLMTHYGEEDIQKMGSYFYGKNIERIVRAGDSLLTVSQYGVASHTENDVQRENMITFPDSQTYYYDR